MIEPIESQIINFIRYGGKIKRQKTHQEACRLISVLENDRKALIEFVQSMARYCETGRKDHLIEMELAREKLTGLGL